MTYSHRNGETEPPTVEGWYWFWGKHIGWVKRGDFPNRKDILHVDSVGNTRYWKRGTAYPRGMPVTDVVGKWWGPLPEPWSAND